MKKFFAFEKDKNKIKLLLFHIKENKVFIEDYRQQEIGIESNASDVIKKFLADNNATGFKTICFLPLSSLYLRKLAFPYKRISKIKKSIKFAIEPHIPIPVETAKVFFRPIYVQNNKQFNFFLSGGIEVLSFVVPEVLLNEQLELINSLGLICNEIYLEPLSIFSFLISRVKAKENVLWLYVGSDTTYIFSVLNGEELADLRQIPFGKDEIMQENSELKREISTILLSQTQTSQLGENKVSAIYVSGRPTIEDKAGGHEICSWLAETFDIPTKAVELDSILSVTRSVEPETKEEISSFTPDIIYASLAKSGDTMNFYPPALQDKERKGIRVAFFLTFFILLIISFKLQFERNIYEEKFNTLNSHIEEIFLQTFPDARDTRTPLLQMKARIKDLRESSSKTDIVSLSPLEALKEISRNLASSLQIELDYFRVKESDVTISGRASSYGDIDKIKSALENSPLFSKVDIESAQTTSQGVNFRLKIVPVLNK